MGRRLDRTVWCNDSAVRCTWSVWGVALGWLATSWFSFWKGINGTVQNSQQKWFIPSLFHGPLVAKCLSQMDASCKFKRNSFLSQTSKTEMSVAKLKMVVDLIIKANDTMNGSIATYFFTLPTLTSSVLLACCNTLRSNIYSRTASFRCWRSLSGSG